MDVVHKIHKDGTVKVPTMLLRKAGLTPGLKIIIQAWPSSLIIERAPRPPALKSLRQLRGSLKHIDWAAVHRDVRERWSAWRNRLSA